MSPIAGREAVELKSDLSDWHPTKSKQANERNLAKRAEDQGIQGIRIFDSSYHVTSPVKARLVTKPVLKRHNACDKLQVSMPNRRPKARAYCASGPIGKKDGLILCCYHTKRCMYTCGVYNVDCQR